MQPGIPLERRAPGFLGRLISGDNIAYLITIAAASAIVLVTALIVFELYSASRPIIGTFGWSFLFSNEWDVNNSKYGALPFLYGTVMTSLIALFFAVPLGVGAAIFLAELAPPATSNFLTFLIELLAAIPSVIYGLIGIFVLVPAMRYVVPGLQSAFGFLPIFSGQFFGVSIFTAGLVLAIMVVPFIISVSREVLLAVPTEQREAALALGATKWETTYQIVLPNARIGVIGSIFLAFARALGETMAVTMVIGNTAEINKSLLAPGYSIASVIANEFAEASGDQSSALICLGLVLFALTILINAIARLLILVTTEKGSK